MVNYEEAYLLLTAASRDLRALQGMTDPGVFADEILGFHAQQAAEKALKAWLSALDVEYPRTHDLTMLLALLALLEAHAQDVNLLFDIVELNSYAVQYRYGAFDDMGSPIDRAAVIARVRDLIAVVGSKAQPDR